ncbi:MULTISPECIES: MaoC family dehydratase [unclassified Iodidimonas]|jgi:acyl dehydratase|uniref:MaoC family dehydratase n=1 Tax=unclassified Iodidimonas TaxID=2626145 RepID=UPI002482CC91|nr:MULTISPECIES: MaoC family dehydratase [unclassified Iodidimonas]
MSQQQQTVFFEDFKIGQEDHFGRYEVTRDEVIDFARRYDPQPFHVDDEAARSSLFGGLCASGWHTCAMTMRMMVDHMKENGVASLGSPGVDEIRWLQPVFPGDVLSVQMKITNTRRLKSRPEIGNIQSDYTVLNQKGEPVLTFKSNGFFAARSAGDSI